MPVVAGNRVTFPARTRLYFGVYGTADVALTHFGLLGQNANMNLEQTFRQKIDGFPEVPVAEAIQAQAGSMEALLRELKKDALLLGLGLHESDIEEAAGGDEVVEDEAVEFNANDVGVLAHPIKIGEAVTVDDGDTTTYTEGTDYFLVPRDLEGRSYLVRIDGGAIPAEGTVYVDYTWNQPEYQEFPIGQIGQVRYWTIRLEEDLTNGGRTEVRLHKARVGIRGAVPFNAPEGADIPVTIQALFDESRDQLMSWRNVEPS